MYVLNFNDRVFFAYVFCTFYQMIVISIMCRVIFHISPKCHLSFYFMLRLVLI